MYLLINKNSQTLYNSENTNTDLIYISSKSIISKAKIGEKTIFDI